MPSPLFAERIDSAVLVSSIPNAAGWAVTVHDDGGLTISPAEGERISQPNYRSLPIGRILAAADALSREERLAEVLKEFMPIGGAERRPGDLRHLTVAQLHWRATQAGLTPRSVVAGAYRVPVQTAGRMITEARRAGVLTDGDPR